MLSYKKQIWYFLPRVEPCYNKDIGTMEITSLYQGKNKQRNIKSWDQAITLL